MGILHTSSATFYICTYSEGRTVAIKKVPKQYFFLNHTVRSEVMQIRSVKEKSTGIELRFKPGNFDY